MLIEVFVLVVFVGVSFLVLVNVLVLVIEDVLVLVEIEDVLLVLMFEFELLNNKFYILYNLRIRFI